MKYNLNDLLKTTLIILGLVIMSIFIYFNYNLSIIYCNANDIPLDYVLTVSGANIVFAMTLTLSVFESIGIYYLCRLSSREINHMLHFFIKSSFLPIDIL